VGNRKLLTLVGSICLILVLAVTSFMVACAPAPTPTITLKIAMWSPPPVAYSRGQVWTWDELAKRSEGRIEVEPYYSGALLPGKEMPEGLEAGIADVATIYPTYYMGKFPLMGVNTNPMLTLELWAAGKSQRDLINEFPEIQEEYTRFNCIPVVTLGGSHPYGIFTKEPISKFEDLAGMRIRSTGAQALLMEAFGAVPVSMVATEAYTALERGTLDGICANASFGIPYGYAEVAKYFFKCHLGTSGHIQAMNLDTWNSLPEDIQQMIRDLEVEQWISWENMFVEEEQILMQKAIDEHGLKITEVGREDLMAAQKLCAEKLWGTWAADVQSKGLPAYEVLGRAVLVGDGSESFAERTAHQ